MIYDYLIVGSGFFGSICARKLTDVGKKVCVIEKRNHVGGNCYTSKKNGINIHEYGPHIFHTSNEFVWSWMNQYVEFNNFTYRPVANYNNEIFSLPFNMWTFNKLWGVTKPSEAIEIINKQSNGILTSNNLEEEAIRVVGIDIYEKLIKGYTTKQWMKEPKFLPKEIIKRLPVRFTYDNNYFFDKYQGIPIGGYTQIFEKLLQDIDVELNTDFFSSKLPNYKKIIYTGPIDKFFNYKFGQLEYKTVKLNHELVYTPNFQGTAVMNYTSLDIPYTRIIEHKHFENFDTDISWISFEYPIKYVSDITEPFYPVNDNINNKIYQKYKTESEKISNYVLFGGRLAEYKYYDMHQVIESALIFIKKEIEFFR